MHINDDDVSSPFARSAATAGAPADAKQAAADADAARLAAEAADDVAPLPDTSISPAATIPAAQAAGTDAGTLPKGSGASAGMADGGAPPARGRKRKLIPLRQVVRYSYEYHGLNDLFFFCITALAVTMVLYWHWGQTTATFKAAVQRSFQQYGNPDWQSQSLTNVDTMYDAVEYTMGWMEFWLQRADNLDWPDDKVRVGELAEVSYVRMLVNLDRNCDPDVPHSVDCYEQDNLTQSLQAGQHGDRSYNNLLDWAGWDKLSRLHGRESANAGSRRSSQWWSYAIIAPQNNGNNATRNDYIGRMYNITRNSNLNYGNCDFANSTCGEFTYTSDGASGPKCTQSNPQVPFYSWWVSPAMCASNETADIMNNTTTSVQRGSRFFVRHPAAYPEADKPNGTGIVLDLKPFLAKYAYSIALDVLAANTIRPQGGESSGSDRFPDRALFSMVLQRSATIKDKPDRIMWQITTTVPVRTSFYSQESDRIRIYFEVLMFLCLVVVLSLQVWQVYVCRVQYNSFKPWFTHSWNCFEALSNITLLAWVIYYLVLVGKLKDQWQFESWDVVGRTAQEQLNKIMSWAASYSAWLYMGIVVDFLICLRLARYMRIHVGLKAFYQVFLIAAREFLDFAVFLFYILVLLGSAVFAFFQLTGGNYQFLRFPDGLSLMSRLTFGFLSYDEFQSQALGVGAAVSAVTFLFWVAVLLLVVYTQNIILAIVAEAYEEAKAKLGTAETSFLMLVLMRILFTTLFVIYRLRMFVKDIMYACTGRKTPDQRLPSIQRSATRANSGASSLLNTGPPGAGQGPSSAASRAASAATQLGDEQWAGEVGASEPSYLMSKPSRYVLPLDVERGLPKARFDRASTAASSRANLLSDGRTSSQFAPGLDAVAGPAGHCSTTCAAGGGAAGPGSSTLVRDSQCSVREGPATLGERLGMVWHDVILGERHILRMYNDLFVAPGLSQDSWIRSWKEKYWRPWCVARTGPVRCLMNLYQDFGCYKLKEECAWLGNSEAKMLIAKAWGERGKKHQTPQQGRDHQGSRGKSWWPCCSFTEGSNSSGVTGHAAADASVDDAAVQTALLTLPVLLDDCYVDEDSLSYLFLAASQVSKVKALKKLDYLWASPFHPLETREVEYLVAAISEVYGVDEDLVMAQAQGVALDEGSGPLAAGPGSTLSSIPSTASREVQFGQQRKSGGGFFSHLNLKRRDNATQHNRQLTWLLHANKRLEESTNRNASQLMLTSKQLQQHLVEQDSFQRRQQRTNSQLLRSMEALTAALQGGQPLSPTAAGVAAAGGGVNADRASSSGLASPKAAAAAGAGVSVVQRINTIAASATSKVLAPFAAGVPVGRSMRSRSGDAVVSPETTALLGEGEAVAAAQAPAVQPGDAPAAVESGSSGDREDTLASTAAAAAGSSDDVVRSLQEQLEQQRRVLEVQQELLQQVLARLPPAQL